MELVSVRVTVNIQVSFFFFTTKSMGYIEDEIFHGTASLSQCLLKSWKEWSNSSLLLKGRPSNLQASGYSAPRLLHWALPGLIWMALMDSVWCSWVCMQARHLILDNAFRELWCSLSDVKMAGTFVSFPKGYQLLELKCLWLQKAFRKWS